MYYFITYYSYQHLLISFHRWKLQTWRVIFPRERPRDWVVVEADHCEGFGLLGCWAGELGHKALSSL